MATYCGRMNWNVRYSVIEPVEIISKATSIWWVASSSPTRETTLYPSIYRKQLFSLLTHANASQQRHLDIVSLNMALLNSVPTKHQQC